MQFYNKYLKYKNKYLNLKKIYGGDPRYDALVEGCNKTKR